MSRPDPRTRRRLALVVAAFFLGFVASPSAVAQTAAPAEERPDVDQFGGFISSARSNGIQVTYDSPGLLPTGSPIIQLSVPEALATLNSGPVGYALSSFAYPGPLIADLGAAMEASGTDAGIPPYPVRSQAFYPSGPTNEKNGDHGIEMTAITEFADSRALTSYSGFDVNPAGFVGAMRSHAQSVVEGDQLVTRSRAAVSDVSLLAGLIKIDSVVTELVATSNGTEGATDGGTTVSGARVLGLPVIIDHDGIRFAEPPESGGGNGSDGEDPTGGALDGALGPVSDGLTEAAGPLNDLLDQVGAAGDDALQQLFEQSGIEVEVLDAIEAVEGGSAQRSAGGLAVTLHYDGANTPVLTDLLALIPSDDLPSENLGPIPFSPQAVAKLFEKQHIQGFAIAPANVSANATPAFEFEAPAFQADTPIDVAPSGSASSGGGDTGTSFETATPDLPPPSAPQTISDIPTSTDEPFPFGDAIPALLVLGVLLGAPFFAAGSSRLADNTLAAVGNSCPAGLDLPTGEAGS